jgi:LacI family transcriptional regulator
MRDVAAAAGVSLTTVSRVLNDAGPVSPETVARVRTAVERTGFRRNEFARRLRSGRGTATIGLLVEDLANPFHSRVAAAVEAVARDRACSVIIASSMEDAAAEQEAVLALCERRVDGLLVVPSSDDHSYLRAEIRAGTPVVFVDRPPRGIDVDAVVADNRWGGRRAVEHLLASGHRRVGVVTDSPTIWTHGERVLGYCEAMEAAGLPVRDEWVAAGNRTPAEAAGATAALLALPARRRPTAVFTTNNRMTVGALSALAGHDGVALVGFDDLELAELLSPPVTVVTNNAFELGGTAARLLFERLAGDQEPPRHVVLRGELVARGSGELPPR